MELAIKIVQEYAYSKIENIDNFVNAELNNDFWENITLGLLLFENAPKLLYKQILQSKLNSEIKDKIISEIPDIFFFLITQLAEDHIKGIKSEAIDILINSKGNLFSDEISFFRTLHRAVEIVEHERVRSELPTMFEKLQRKILGDDI